jgi:hypothetical protein
MFPPPSEIVVPTLFNNTNPYDFTWFGAVATDGAGGFYFHARDSLYQRVAHMDLASTPLLPHLAT